MLHIDGEYLDTVIDLRCGYLLGVILTAWAARPGRQRGDVARFPVAGDGAGDGDRGGCHDIALQVLS